MADDRKDQPIIVVKKNGGHAGHHGGAWKVAYADFVTAMMAFFLVMWLVSQSDQVKDAVQMYFQDPQNFKQNYNLGVLKKGSGVLRGAAGAGQEAMSSKTLEEQLREEMENLATRLRGAIESMPGLDVLKNHVELEVTREGLRIQLIEGSDNVTFFKPGSAIPTLKGELILKTIAMELGKLSNQLVIEGHTNSNDAGHREDYTNWELSTARANAARRVMMESGLNKGQVYQVRGYADKKLRIKDHPNDPRNRRITILVLNRLTGKENPSDSYESPIIMSKDG